MSGEALDYPYLMREALREVPRKALLQVAESGLPGAHHFYLSFRTDVEGVEVPEPLRERYPEEMTVVLQHQWWDLQVDRDAFAVSLSFGGSPQQIRVPFAALTAFIDPTAEFGLRFDGGSAEASEERPTGPHAVAERDEGAQDGGSQDGGDQEVRPRAKPRPAPAPEALPDDAGTAAATPAEETAAEDGPPGSEGEGDPDDEPEGPAEVVSIDRFRKK